MNDKKLKNIEIDNDLDEEEVFVLDQDEVEEEIIEVIEEFETKNNNSIKLRRSNSLLEDVSQYPNLSKEEEYELAYRSYFYKDKEAFKKLFLHNLKFVNFYARKFIGYGLNSDDITQEGYIGLGDAITKFNPETKVRLISYAVYHIKSKIFEYIINNIDIVKIATTKGQRKLFFNLKDVKNKLESSRKGFSKEIGWLTGEEIKLISKELKVNPQEVKLMETRLQGSNLPFDGYNDSDDEFDFNNPSNYLTDENSNFVEEIEIEEAKKSAEIQIKNAISHLDNRTRDIIESRYLKENKETLEDLALKYGVSAERVRQIEVAGFKKIREKVSHPLLLDNK